MGMEVGKSQKEGEKSNARNTQRIESGKESIEAADHGIGESTCAGPKVNNMMLNMGIGANFKNREVEGDFYDDGCGNLVEVNLGKGENTFSFTAPLPGSNLLINNGPISDPIMGLSPIAGNLDIYPIESQSPLIPSPIFASEVDPVPGDLVCSPTSPEILCHPTSDPIQNLFPSHPPLV